MTEHDRDPLDQLLVERPVSDDGFTDRVMSRLPAPTCARRPLPRALVLGGAATLGTLLAMLSPGTQRIAAMVSEVLSSPSRGALMTHTTAVIVLAAIAVVLVGSGAQIATNE